MLNQFCKVKTSLRVKSINLYASKASRENLLIIFQEDATSCLPTILRKKIALSGCHSLKILAVTRISGKLLRGSVPALLKTNLTGDFYICIAQVCEEELGTVINLIKVSFFNQFELLVYEGVVYDWVRLQFLTNFKKSAHRVRLLQGISAGGVASGCAFLRLIQFRLLASLRLLLGQPATKGS